MDYRGFSQILNSLNLGLNDRNLPIVLDVDKFKSTNM